jgi:hypothetical protein
MPFAFTAASSLFMVSSGPWLLLTVVNPSAAISALHRYLAAVGRRRIIASRRQRQRAFFDRQPSG